MAECCHRMSDPGPQESMKSTQIYRKSSKIDEIHRKSSQAHQIPQESMKSTKINLKSHKINEIQRKSSRGPQILQFHGNPWKSPSELPASMIPGFQARCIESSGHQSSKSSSPWSYQTTNRVPTRSPNPATGRHRMSDLGPQDSMKFTQIHLKSFKINEIHSKIKPGTLEPLGIYEIHTNPLKII